MDELQRQWQFIDRVEGADGDGEIISVLAKVEPILFDLDTAGGAGEPQSGINHIDVAHEFPELLHPAGGWAADQKAALERPHKIAGSSGGCGEWPFAQPERRRYAASRVRWQRRQAAPGF